MQLLRSGLMLQTETELHNRFNESIAQNYSIILQSTNYSDQTVSDGTCGLLSLLPNMFRHYGWNPGERAMRWFGECLAVKTGNPDITFQEVSCVNKPVQK